MFGVEGDVWVATATALLRSQDSGATYAAVTGATGAPTVNGATAVGFGPPVAAGASYPAVYLAGSVGGVWGIYRSDDAGTTWQRIDDPQHQFGYINVLAGDRRQAGRVYLGTSGRGIVYGDPQRTVTPGRTNRHTMMRGPTRMGSRALWLMLLAGGVGVFALSGLQPDSAAARSRR